MEIYIPPALVLGCNKPHSIGILSDWIEEQTGHPLDLDQSGWSDMKNNIKYFDVEDTIDRIDCEYYYQNGDGSGRGLHQANFYGDGMGVGDYGYLNGNGFSSYLY